MPVPAALLALPLLLLPGKLTHCSVQNITALLHVTISHLFFFPWCVAGGFPGAASGTVTLKEGENLNLHCTFSTLSNSDSSALQWLNPRGFTIFFNAEQVLKDQRYKLLRHSKDELSIQLSNVTVQDAGIYSCLSYSSNFQNKTQNVEILAAPSQPVLEVSQDSGRGIKLSCHTQGCKPLPQISWLLDNGMELQEQNPASKGRVKKERNLLLPILVAALVFVLLVIVLLFMVKLKKAHGVWKRENDVSEQTLESYKSRSNEDSPGHEKNGQAANPKSNVQYVTEGHVETPEKNPETPEKNLEPPEKNPGDKNLAISEKMFECGRETDI
ncbi:cytotoxic and regulatory T-cell molecule [Sylvia borin]